MALGKSLSLSEPQLPLESNEGCRGAPKSFCFGLAASISVPSSAGITCPTVLGKSNGIVTRGGGGAPAPDLGPPPTGKDFTKWPTHMRKGAQHHESSEKYKLKPQRVHYTPTRTGSVFKMTIARLTSFTAGGCANTHCHFGKAFGRNS